MEFTAFIVLTFVNELGQDRMPNNPVLQIRPYVQGGFQCEFKPYLKTGKQMLSEGQRREEDKCIIESLIHGETRRPPFSEHWVHKRPDRLATLDGGFSSGPNKNQR